MTEALQQEIRTLRSLLDSPRDPGGRVFAPLADAYRRAGRIPEALRLLNEGLAKHPDFATAHVVASRIYVEQGLSTEGAFAARRALDLDGENVLALRSLLRVLDESGDAEAEDVRGRLLALEPDFTPDWGVVAAAAEATSAWQAPPAHDAPTVPVRAIRGTAPTAIEPAPEIAAETVSELLEITPSLDEVSAPVEGGFLPTIDLGTIAPLPAAELPLSALGPDLSPPAESMDLGLQELLPADASLEALAPQGTDMPGFEAGVPPSAEPAVDELLMDLAALAPEPRVDEPVMDLAALAPEPELDEPVMDLALLAPEPAPDQPPVDLAELAPREKILSLDALAPDASAVEEPVMELAALAPDEEVISLDALAPDEEIVSLDALAPDAPVVEEPIMDLAALAPDAPSVEEPVLDLAALAPDEEIVSLAALAPDTPVAEEPVMDLAALAPDAPVAEEPVMDLAALAPDAPAAEEPVMDLAALAPDAPAVEEPVMDLAALAPDEEIVSLDALAPDEPAADAPVMDVAALAPVPVAVPPLEAPPRGLDYYEEPVFDLDALAPAGVGSPPSVPLAAPRSGTSTTVPTTGEDAVDIAFLSPDEPDAIVIDLDALRPEGTPPPAAVAPTVEQSAAPTAPSAPMALQPPSPSVPGDGDDGEAEASASPEEQGQPVYTRTLAELYAAQGATKQAVDVLKHLQAQNPTDADLGRRIAELEAAGPPTPSPELGAAAKREAEVEALARDLAESGHSRHEVDTPFAWTDDEPRSPAKTAGPTIREYFDGMLNWEPRGGA